MADKDLYEIHITVARPDHSKTLWGKLEKVANFLHWKTSFIKGDPAMGKDAFFYFTTYTSDEEKAHTRIKDMEGVLDLIDVKVLRKKIEKIVYDWRAPKLPKIR